MRSDSYLIHSLTLITREARNTATWTTTPGEPEPARNGEALRGYRTLYVVCGGEVLVLDVEGRGKCWG